MHPHFGEDLDVLKSVQHTSINVDLFAMLNEKQQQQQQQRMCKVIATADIRLTDVWQSQALIKASHRKFATSLSCIMTCH